jgi:hypothetical protein
VAAQVVKVVDTLKGWRPFRVFVDPAAEDVFRMGDRVRQWFYQGIRMPDLVSVGSCHRNRLASDHLHEHAIAVHYDDPDVAPTHPRDQKRTWPGKSPTAKLVAGKGDSVRELVHGEPRVAHR